MAMRRYLAVALLLAGTALAAGAQRGATHGGLSPHGSANFSHAGAAPFSAHNPAAFSGRIPAGLRSSPAGFRGFSSARRYDDANGHSFANRGFRAPSTLPLARPSFYSRRPSAPWRPGRPIDGRNPWRHHEDRDGDRHEDRNRGLGFNLGYGYGYAGWIAPDYLGYCDPDFDDCNAGLGDYGAPGYGYGAPGYDDGAPSYGDAQGYEGEQSQGYGGPAAAPPDDIAPYAGQPQPYAPSSSQPYAPAAQSTAVQSAAAQPAPAAAEDAITLVFKDGRPPEQIRNYALTRTTLYVIRDGHRRDIPVSDLDLAATERANETAGVAFRLPHTAAP